MATSEETISLFPIFILTIMALPLVPYTIVKLCHFSSKKPKSIHCQCDVCARSGKYRKSIFKKISNFSTCNNMTVILLWVITGFLVNYIQQISRESQPFDPFNILGLESGASDSEIKKAYKKLSIQYHPDKKPDSEANLYFVDFISKAYQALTDPISRENYKKYGHPDGRQVDILLFGSEALQCNMSGNDQAEKDTSLLSSLVNSEHNATSVDVGTLVIHDLTAGVPTSCSYIHPLIRNKLTQSSELLQQDHAVSETHETMKKDVPITKSHFPGTHDDDNQDGNSTCITTDFAVDGITLKQLDMAKKMGVLDLSPEDEFEGQLIYLQNKLFDQTIASKRYCDELVSRVVKSLNRVSSNHDMDSCSKGRVSEPVVKTRGSRERSRNRSPRRRPRDDHIGGRDSRRRSRSRSRERYDDRSRGRGRDSRHRSGSRSLSPDYRKGGNRSRYEEERQRSRSKSAGR